MSELDDALTRCVEIAPQFSLVTHVTRRVNELLDLNYTDAKWRGILKDKPIDHERIKKALGTAENKTPETISVTGNVVGAVVNDIHAPYHDKYAIELACKVLAWWQPEEIVYNGDLTDFYELSKYDQNPGRSYRIQDEIDILHTDVFAPVNHAVGRKCKKRYTRGNHEYRLHRYLCQHPELFGIRELELYSLLQLEKYGISYASYSVQYGDVLEVSHGTKVNQWAGMSAKAEQLSRRFGINTITGHVHRAGTFKTRTRHGWVTGQESPCLCTLKPEWANNVDWQHGLTLFVIEDGNCTIHPIEFNGRVAQFGKKTFRV